jgi:ABC-type phosphate transport system permease subunit
MTEDNPIPFNKTSTQSAESNTVASEQTSGKKNSSMAIRIFTVLGIVLFVLLAIVNYLKIAE